MIKMRSNHKRQEIQEILNQAQLDDSKVTIWQFEGESRRIFSGALTSISDDKTIILMKNLKQSEYLLRQDEPLYVHGTYKKFVFKRDTFTLEGDKLSVKTPSELKLEDLRECERFTYKYQDHKAFTFRALSVKTKEEVTITAVLTDLSIKGAGVIIGSEEATHLGGHCDIQITSITDQKLQHSHPAKVIYRVTHQDEKDGETSLFRFGIIFESQMDAVNFKSISSIIDKKQKKVKGISQTTFCGLEHNEQEKILENIKQNDSFMAGKLRDNIEYLDNIKYLTSQMKKQFLQEISHSILAVALKLSHKEIIYELLTEVTETMQEEVLFHMKDQMPVSAIKSAQEKVCEYIREKEKSGEFILDPESFITYV